MPIDYGAPKCPQSQPWNRKPGDQPCPRSDTYRAIENGNNHAIWGWLFRCRTCGTMFFGDQREVRRMQMRQRQMDELMRGGR